MPTESNLYLKTPNLKMSISSQLLILNQTKQNINQAINLKGVTVTDEPFAEYPDKVRLIPCGTGTYESQIILYLEGRLKHAEIPYGTTTIGNSAFRDSDAGTNMLRTVSIPSTVTTIEPYAFYYQSHMTEITLPASITSIGEGAFAQCINLTSITCPATVPPTLGYNALSTTNEHTVVYVPAESLLAYQTASVWINYSDMIQPIP